MAATCRVQAVRHASYGRAPGPNRTNMEHSAQFFPSKYSQENWPTNWSPRSRVLQKLTIVRLVKKLPTPYGAHRFLRFIRVSPNTREFLTSYATTEISVRDLFQSSSLVSCRRFRTSASGIICPAPIDWVVAAVTCKCLRTLARVKAADTTHRCSIQTIWLGGGGDLNCTVARTVTWWELNRSASVSLRYSYPARFIIQVGLFSGLSPVCNNIIHKFLNKMFQDFLRASQTVRSSDVWQCSLIGGYQPLGGTYCLRIHGYVGILPGTKLRFAYAIISRTEGKQKHVLRKTETLTI
jgi:hypothetical protein